MRNYQLNDFSNSHNQLLTKTK